MITLNEETRTLVLGRNDCISCRYRGEDRKGLEPSLKYKICDKCKGTGKRGNGKCRTCVADMAYGNYKVIPGRVHYWDHDDMVVCSRCIGAYKDFEPAIITDYLDPEIMLTLFPVDKIKVYRQNKKTSWIESNLGGLGANVLWSSSGFTPNQDDNKLIEEVTNSSSFKSPQACKVVNKDNQAADHIGIFTSSYGYTVRAVFSLEHAKLMELASSVLTPEEALECLRPF